MPRSLPLCYGAGMAKTSIQICSTSALPVEGEEWIPIIPVGTFRTFDGRGPFHLEKPEEVVAASRREIVELVIDRDHVTDHAPPGAPRPAAGWIKELKVDGDRVMARVDWTPPALEQLKNREYRYISPVFTYDKNNRVLRILRASLTNDPALEMKAVASVDPQKVLTPTENTMDELLQELAALLGLEGESVSAEAVKEAIATLQATVTGVKEAVDAPEEATTPEAVVEAVEEHVEEEVEKAVASAQRKATASNAKPDPREYVPMKAFKELQSQVATMNNETVAGKVTAAVEGALKEGKITPGQKTWATDYATKDLAGFEKYVEEAPALLAASNMPRYAPAKNDDGLSHDDAEVAALLGLAPEKMKADA